MNNKKYISNPLNYCGSKDRLLPQIEPQLDYNCKYLVEPFAGSAIVTANLGHKYEYCYSNDKCWQLIELLKYLQRTPIRKVLGEIDSIVELFDLSKTNEDGHIELKFSYNAWYNKKHNFCPTTFYALLTNSFNNMIHINSKGEFNNSFGRNRSHFNKSLRQKLIKYVEQLQSINVELSAYCYEDFMDYIEAGEDGDLSKYIFFVDPPYILTDSSYSRIHYNKWLDNHEKMLYDRLDYIDICGGKFLLTNVLTKGDKCNTVLDKWKDKYNVIETDNSYNNCNYQKKDEKDIEIFVRNY